MRVPRDLGPRRQIHEPPAEIPCDGTISRGPGGPVPHGLTKQDARINEPLPYRVSSAFRDAPRADDARFRTRGQKHSDTLAPPGRAIGRCGGNRPRRSSCACLRGSGDGVHLTGRIASEHVPVALAIPTPSANSSTYSVRSSHPPPTSRLTVGACSFRVMSPPGGVGQDNDAVASGRGRHRRKPSPEGSLRGVGASPR